MSDTKDKEEIEQPLTQPTLTTSTTTTEKDLITALNLISTSIAEQRQTTSRALIHRTPFLATVLGLITPLVLVTEYYRLDRVSAAFTGLAIVAAALKSVELITAGYLDAAGDIGWEWLYGGDRNGDENEHEWAQREDRNTDKEEMNIIFVSRWKDSIVGTLVLRVYPAPPSTPTPTSKTKKKPLIRAWTVKQAYRGNGVGRSLLHLAITHCRSSGWDDPEFAVDHANCLRVLPGWFYGGLVPGERVAREVLERELREVGGVDGDEYSE
jgi:dynein heavy chain 1